MATATAITEMGMATTIATAMATPNSNERFQKRDEPLACHSERSEESLAHPILEVDPRKLVALNETTSTKSKDLSFTQWAPSHEKLCEKLHEKLNEVWIDTY